MSFHEIMHLLCPQYSPFRTRYIIFKLYQRTVMTSGGFFQEIKAVLEGLSLEINQRIRDVDALERDLEVCFPELLLSLI